MKAAGTIRSIAVANQNAPLSAVAIVANADTPQWYDVKFLAERMFDLRGMVRDAIRSRRGAEQLRQRYAALPARQIVTAEIHGHSMDIALAWHDYRIATAAYHSAWEAYQHNLRR
ncbi:MAG: hypothetical protein H6865_02160 [Rhodospirillales bacterium]|nr:hypothetical protein [Rhodospirillales bacterium]USO07035.1 MAG: hypothetical protein H6866_06225 [Rhodospirillales bacterium]